jgi:hypothetical protein
MFAATFRFGEVFFTSLARIIVSGDSMIGEDL